MRSLQEIRFRLRQELGNLAMFLFPPGGRAARQAPFALPGTGDARELIATADSILEHRFPILGVSIDTGPQIDWRRDYLHKISSGTQYFRGVPYLDFSRVGDHKVVWELNRHQHLVLLSQAFLLGRQRAYLDEVFRQLESWMDANPFLRGINWASALEVAFRALSWIWVWQFAGGEMSAPLRERFLTGLYRHARFLELNLSVYFSPNTHLLGEAVALHALGVLFGDESWSATGGRIVEEELGRQVRDDGSHFEQSAYYHVYALDFFLLYRSAAVGSKNFDARVERMAEYLDALLGQSGILPLIGDDDGGRLFHPYGDRAQFGRGTLAACAAIFGQRERVRVSRLFKDAGTAVMCNGDAQVVIKAGGFGEGSGGHSHSDVLSLVVRIGDREILIDPGTFTYIADPVERNEFRGSGAHNTVRIDGRDQAIPAGPFRWNEKPDVVISKWATSPARDYLDATCSYGGFRHRRRVLFAKPSTLVVLDRVEGPDGKHTVEQSWHLGSPDDEARFSFSAEAERVEMWRSRALCTKERAPGLRVRVEGELPIQIAAVIDLSAEGVGGPVEVRGDEVLWRGQVLSMAPNR